MQCPRNDHQQNARWRMTFTILCLLGVFASVSETAPTDLKTPTLERLVDSPKDSFGERVGSPIELAWQAWLILNKSEKGASLSEDPATLVRRITPKSIFIAPELNNGCSGQNYDENRCKHIKTINVNTSLQRKFLLDRLNAKHDKQKQQEQSKIFDVAGPFQLNIPLDKGISNDNSPKATELPKIPDVEPLNVKFTQPEESSEKKDSKPEKDIINIQVPEETLPEHVPVVDFVHEESNESYADLVVDYKIPMSDKRTEQESKETIINSSVDKDEKPLETTTLSITSPTPTTTSTTTSKYVPPTLIVLLGAPTKAPPAVSETLDELVKQMENSTGNWTKGLFSSIIPIEEESFVNSNFPRNVTQDVIVVNSTLENDDIYSDEDPFIPEEDSEGQEDYSTEDSITESSDDDFAETTEDELLKPGEAGMTIPVMTNQQFDKSEWSKDEAEKEMTTETPEVVSTIKPINIESKTEINTTPGPDDTDVNVSSEVSVNDDFVMETTLVDVNTEKIKNNTEATTPAPTTTNVDFVTVKINKEDQFESEKELLPKPEVVFPTPLEQHLKSSPQVKPVIVWGIDEETAKKQNDNPLKVNLGLLSMPKEDSFEEQASFDAEKVALPDSSPKFQPIPSPIFKQGFVRFPTHEERPHSSSYVRFPSDDVNSIHSLDFKPRVPHTHNDFASTTSTKSSVPFYQKQPWHRSSRTDRQHSGFKYPWGDLNRQPKAKQQTHLQDFWIKLPTVVPDLVHLPTTNHGSQNDPYSGDSPRRSRFKAV